MGSNTSRKTCTNMKLAVICLALVATIASTHEDVDPFEFMTPEVSLFDDTPQENIVAAAQQLQSLSQRHMAVHVNEITKHAALVQEAATVEDEDESDKAKAYAHNFSASKAAITAALKGLNDQLVAGHNHDKAALSSAKGNADNSISSMTSNAESKINGYKKQTCPAKRDEEAADEAKKSAKKVVDGIKGRKICPLSSTWGDMDVEKSVPKFGTELRNKWDKTRAEYSKAKAAYDSAVKAHQDATNKYNTAMAAFKTALTVEANNVHTACLNAHKEHKALATEVASRFGLRHWWWVATWKTSPATAEPRPAQTRSAMRTRPGGTSPHQASRLAHPSQRMRPPGAQNLGSRTPPTAPSTMAQPQRRKSRRPIPRRRPPRLRRITRPRRRRPRRGRLNSRARNPLQSTRRRTTRPLLRRRRPRLMSRSQRSSRQRRRQPRRRIPS